MNNLHLHNCNILENCRKIGFSDKTFKKKNLILKRIYYFFLDLKSQLFKVYVRLDFKQKRCLRKR